MDDFNPRSPHGERRGGVGQKTIYIQISIHALLTESDIECFLRAFPLRRISIHALLTESDKGRQHDHLQPPRFQSTLSSRRATLAQYIAKAAEK